jgi:hypothetical protein
MFLLITIKTDPIIAGILFSSKPIFLTIKRKIHFITKIRLTTYRPYRSLNGIDNSPPKTPPNATTEIAVEYKIS